jgi:hypothetical protein
MGHKIAIALVFSLCVVCAEAQSKSDSIIIADAQNVVNLTFAKDSVPQNYLVFSLNDYYMLIYESEGPAFR